MRAMKDSGIEWIGEIPEEWKIKRFKNIGVCRNGLTYSPNDLTSKDSGILVLRSSNIQDGKLSFQDNVYVKSEVKETLKVHKGDILICSRNGSAKLIGKNTIIPEGLDAAFGAFMMIFRCGCPEYMRYILNSEIFNYNLASFLTSTVNQLTGSNFLNIKTCFVDSIEEREKIVSYLDVKSYKLESIIAKEQEVITKLQEYKLSLITEKVTKGLNPNVEMKDSGIEWIGEIPKHWELNKLKFATKIMRGKFNHRPRNDERYYDGEYPFVQTGDVARAGKYIDSYNQTLNELGFSVSKEFPAGSVCMTIAANVGDVAVLNFNACFPDSVVGFYPKNKNHWNFLYYALKAMKQQFTRNAIISTQLNLNIEIIKEEYIPVCDEKEQQAIASYLDTKCAAIDAAIAKKQALIEKFTEYKKSLIYEVVTGKKEVC